MMVETEDVLAIAAAWLAEGDEVALATVVQCWGSAPRRAGSQMAVSRSLRMAGSVSSGCVEGEVAEAAQAVIESGLPRLLQVGVSDERAWSHGLACGGQIEVFIEPIAAAPAPARP